MASYYIDWYLFVNAINYGVELYSIRLLGVIVWMISMYVWSVRK